MPPRKTTSYSPSLVMQFMLSLRSLVKSTWCRLRSYSYCQSEIDFQAVDQVPSRFNVKAAPFVPIRPPPGLCDGTDNAKQQLASQEVSVHKSRDPGWRKPQPRISTAMRDTLVALSEGREPCEMTGNTRNSQLFSPQSKAMPARQHLRHEALSSEETSFRPIQEKMARYSEEQIILARGIRKFGFNPARFLEPHFKQFGKVEAVFAGHATEKINDRRSQPRIRPAGVAFVVMGTVREARAAMDAGTVQKIHGLDVTVGKYESPQILHDGHTEAEDQSFDECTRWVDRVATSLAP